MRLPARYRHTNDGQYYATSDGRYFGTNGKYNSIYSAYQQQYEPQTQFFRTYTPPQQFVNRFGGFPAQYG